MALILLVTCGLSDLRDLGGEGQRTNYGPEPTSPKPTLAIVAFSKKAPTCLPKITRTWIDVETPVLPQMRTIIRT